MKPLSCSLLVFTLMLLGVSHADAPRAVSGNQAAKVATAPCTSSAEREKPTSAATPSSKPPRKEPRGRPARPAYLFM